MFEELKELELLEIDGGRCTCWKDGNRQRCCLSPIVKAVCMD